MTREIKFRGKRVDTGEWVYGYLCFIYVNGKNEKGFIFTDKAQIYDQENCVNRDVLAKTVGQFTGEKDINNKEIYEGDIIRISSEYLVQVIFEDGSFGIDFLEDSDDLFEGFWSFIALSAYTDTAGKTLDSDIKIYGNIHDNPELLKEIK